MKAIAPEAYSVESIRARIVLIGRERGVPDAEIEKVLRADLHGPDDVVLKFIVDQDLSCDWLFVGDLEGLRRMRWPSSTWDYVDCRPRNRTRFTAQGDADGR